MTRLDFLSTTIGQLIWPLIIVVVVLILKEPIKKMANSPRLKRFKVGPGGLEAEFNEDLTQVEKDLKAAQSPRQLETSKQVDTATSDFLHEMAQLAAVAPRAVVLESFMRLESLLRSSIDAPDHQSGPKFRPIRTLGRIAVDQQLITEGEASVLDELAYLRNRVAHGPEENISQDAAIRYADAVSGIAIAINVALGHTRFDGRAL